MPQQHLHEADVGALFQESGREAVAERVRYEAIIIAPGWVLSRERQSLRGADALEEGGRPHPGHRYREMPRDPARSETPCMYGNTSRENRKIPCPPAEDGAAGGVGKSKDTRR